MIAFEREEHAAVEAQVVEAQVVDVEVIELDAAEAILVDAVVVEPQPLPQTPAEKGAHLRVAPDGYKRRRRVRIAAAAAGVSLSATLFAVVGFNVVLAQNQIELQDLQHKLQVEESRYYDLRNDVAQASSPQRIVKKASSIGLVNASPTYVRAGVKLPELGPTDTAETLRETSRATGGSLDHPVP